MKKTRPFLILLSVLAIATAQAEAINSEDTKSLNDTGVALYKAGKYAEAEQLFQKSLAISEKNLGQDHPDVAAGLNNLAEVYQAQGKYEQVELLLQRSLAIREKSLHQNDPVIAESLNNLAMLYQTQGKYALAEPLLQKSLAIDELAFGKEHPDVASDLNNLAGLYANQSQYEKAEPLYLRCLAIDEKVLGKEHPNVASDLNNLAGIYLSQKQYEKAQALYSRSLAIREKVLSKNHPYLAISLNNLAELYRNWGQYQKAESFYQRSLAIKENALGANHPDLATGLDNFAMLYASQGLYEKAEPMFQRSFNIMNQALERWLWGAGEKTRQSYLQKQESRRNYYLTLYSFRNHPEQALNFSLARKGMLLRIASEVSSLAKQSSDPVIAQQTQEFNRLKTRLSTLVLSGKANKTEIQALEENINQLEMQLSQQVSSFKRSKTEVTAAQVLEKLTSKQALVDFLVYTEVDLKNQKNKAAQVIALLADKKKGIKLIKLGDLASISEAITAYRQNILPTPAGQLINRKEVLNPASQKLYRLIWQPLSPYLANKTEVFLIPDGILHLLPFKALLNEKGEYLAQKQQIILLSSARDLVLPPLSGKSNAAVIFAAPAYGDNGDKTANTTTRSIATRQQELYFSPLEGAAAEGKAIGELIKARQPVQLFQDLQASEASVSAIRSPRLLHFATHGFFLANQPAENNENPLSRSGLALVGANLGINGKTQADGTDGILTALEVLGLDLTGTEVVTLSACETGVGDIQIGEGVYSLNRAFQEAGAKAVLSSLWSVADEQTNRFMQHFYTLILNKVSPQQALQQTQLKFMQQPDTKDPFFWAAFTVVGND